VGYHDGLGRAARMHVIGEPVTREQANEIMLRTNRWHMLSCNDQEWCDTVDAILGIDDRFDALVEAGECEDTWDDWCKRHFGLIEAFGEDIGALKIGYLNNESIMDCSDEPSGWMSWDGTIRADWTIPVKYPEVEEIEAEWVTIAEAFPFLELRAQALSGGFGCYGAAPQNTVIAEWRIRHGQVSRMYIHPAYPPKPLLPIRWRERWEESRLARWWQYKVRWSRPVKRLTAPYWALYRARRRNAWPQPHRTWGSRNAFEERYVSAPRLIEAVDQVVDSR
jgi:hypothetical protein